MKSFGSAYAILAFLCLMGLFPMLGSGGSMKTTREKYERLMREGRPTPAIVTRKWHQGGKYSYQAIAYRYQIDGRTYEGSSDPGQSLWWSLKVGSPIQVAVMPSQPDVSQYRPDIWLAHQGFVQRIGFVIAGFAGLSFVLIGLLDLAARSNMGFRATVERFAPRAPAFFIGSIFAAAGIGFQAMILYQALFQGGYFVSSRDNPPHPATTGDYLGTSLFLAVFWGLGLFLMLGPSRFIASRRVR